MGGFADLIGGVGAGAGGLGQQLREHQFQHNENAFNHWHLQREQLAQQLETAAKEFPGPEGQRIRNMQFEVSTANPANTPDFTKHAGTFSKLYDEAAQRVAERAAAKAREIPPVQPPTAQNSSPFGATGGVPNYLAQMIGGAPAQSAATAAQPATSPLTSPAAPIGGGSTAGGTFPGPPPASPSPAVHPGSSGAASAEPVPPGANALGPVPGANSPVPPQPGAAPVVPVAPPIPLDLQRSIDWANAGGMIDPLAAATIPGQAQLHLGQQKLPLVRGILDQLGPGGMASGPNGLPDLSKLMRVQAELSALGVQGGAGNMLGPLLSAATPVNEMNVTAGSIETQWPGLLAQHGLTGLDPKTPLRVRVNKFTGIPVSIYRQSIGERYFQTAGGGFEGVNPRTGEVSGPVSGAVAPSQNTPIRGVTGSGNVGVTSLSGMKSGEKPRDTGLISPSVIGTQQTPSGGVNKTIPRAAPGGASPSGTPRGSGGGASLAPATRPFDPSNELDHKALMMAKDATAAGHLMTNASDKARVNQRMAELGLEPGMVTNSMRERAKNARLILDHLNDINSIINQAEKDGDLGVVASRWNNFLTNKLGADPTKTQVFAKLSSELGFLSTAVAMAHGGLRGGSSPTMVEHWETALEAKDPATLRAKLGEARKWMEGYAKLDKGTELKEIPPVQSAPDLGSYRKKYNY